MSDYLPPMSPAQFKAEMQRIAEQFTDPRDALPAGIGVLVICLASNGYQDGLDIFDQATRL